MDDSNIKLDLVKFTAVSIILFTVYASTSVLSVFRFNCTICLGVYVPESHHYYYYPGFRKQGRFPAAKKTILKNLDLLKEIEEEERTTVRQKRATDCGYTGLSVLHRLYPLYGFLYDEHIVFDEMHTVSLNIVKHALQDLMEDEENTIDWAIVDQRLNAIPWPKGKTMWQSTESR